MSAASWIHEIFASIQGEGICCGRRQTFVRFAGCNLACDYCDTPYARAEHVAACRAEDQPGTRSFEAIANPIAVEDVVSICRRLDSRQVALTGGEPLMQAEPAAELMRALREGGFGTYLETNGTLHDELPRVVDLADVIAMDIKLPSACGKIDLWEAHAQFLAIASSAEVFVKTVVVPETTRDELSRAARLIADVGAGIPLVIQPASGRSFEPEWLMRLQEAAGECLDDVRVIPQCHKAMGLP